MSSVAILKSNDFKIHLKNTIKLLKTEQLPLNVFPPMAGIA